MKKVYSIVFAAFAFLSLGAQPSNDDLCNAISLTLDEDCSTNFPYTTLGASPQLGEPIPSCFPDGSVEVSVWFSFTGPASGVVSINTDFSGSEMQDTQLALYELPTGDCSDLFTLVEIACNEDAAPVPVNTQYNAVLAPVSVNPGQIYFILVDGYNDYGYLSEGAFCIVVNEVIPPPNNDCSTAENYGGFGFSCTKIFNGTTIGASSNGNADIFSCDLQPSNASVYYTFNATNTEVEFNVLTGDNINVTLFTTCNGVEISGNCFLFLDASPDPNILFTNLIQGTNYTMAIWTNEGEETDFSFCLTQPSYVCGDTYCYAFTEDYGNCPLDCPCESELFFYDINTFGQPTTAYGLCPEIVNGTTDPNNPGLYIPFALNTNDADLTGAQITSTAGAFYAPGSPPSPLVNNEPLQGSVMYLFLTQAEIASGGLVTITFASDNGACSAEISFDINDLTGPDVSECGNCNLIIIPDYDSAICVGSTVNIDVTLQNASGSTVCVNFLGDQVCNPAFEPILDPFNPTTLNFQNSDITITIFDEGLPNCSYQTTLYLADFACSGSEVCVDTTDTPTACRLEPQLTDAVATCNADGTLNIPIDIGRPTGLVTFNPDIVSGSGTDGDPYTVQIDLNNCASIDLTISDESTCDETPIVTINSPASIAGGVTVGTNTPDWGVQISTELGLCGSGSAVEGNVVELNDENTTGGQLTDFCEPVPPVLPDASVCANLTGNIVLIDRGACSFTSKVENAQNCGAIGVVVCNCLPGPSWCPANSDALLTMAGGGSINPITIPAVFMLYEDCERIRMELNNGNDVDLCIGASELLTGCEREFSLDVCNDYSTVACDDGDCSTENDVSTVDASGAEICACAGTSIQCATGEIFNETTCMCEADGPCEEEIMGSISTPDEGCDVSGIDIMIMAPDGSSVTVTTGVDGTFTVPGGPFPCGIYSATIVTPQMDLPDCYSATGTIGPIQFEVDGTGNGDDGPNFIANPDIPTLSQWGLTVLALLLMITGTLKLGFSSLKMEF